MTPELLALWADYWRTGSRTDRNRLTVRYLPLTKRIAARMAAGCPPNVEVDDLTSVGVLGLIESIERFNPNHPAAFEISATRHIKCAMSDFLRTKEGGDLTREMWDQMWGNPTPKLRSLPTELADPAPGPAAIFEAKETAAVVAAARQSLNAQQQQVVRLHFDEGMTLAEIGKIMGLTQGWVSQIKTEALKKLGIRAHLAAGRQARAS